MFSLALTFKDDFLRRGDDIEFGNKAIVKDFEGNIVQTLPLFYLKFRDREAINDMSTDIVSTMIAYANMAHNYREMDKVIEDFDIQKDYTRGGYNNPCKEVREAIYLMARKEAILLDPCYTGKGFAGIIDMVRDGKMKPGEKVIFIHTGGFPGLYTLHHRVEFEKELEDGIRIIK